MGPRPARPAAPAHRPAPTPCTQRQALRTPSRATNHSDLPDTSQDREMLHCAHSAAFSMTTYARSAAALSVAEGMPDHGMVASASHPHVMLSKPGGRGPSLRSELALSATEGASSEQRRRDGMPRYGCLPAPICHAEPERSAGEASLGPRRPSDRSAAIDTASVIKPPGTQIL